MIGSPPAPAFLRYADLFAALGTEPRLRIVHLLLRAHPEGLVVGQIQAALGMQPSALSHHLEKLRHENLVRVQREGTFLRYTVHAGILQELLEFLFSECCAKSRAVPADSVFRLCQENPK
jgi:DNA-binding transcriptional ArsR family regulator